MIESPKKEPPFSFSDYLEWEAQSELKHEFFNGAVFAMDGASDNHDLVAVNILSALHQHLKGKSCRVHSADMKLKVRLKHAEAGYYPDSMVVCDPGDSEKNYKTKPQVIIEVMSDFRRDHVEKFVVYQQVDSLKEYIVIDQDPDTEKQRAWIYRRDTGWEQEVIKNGESLVIPSIDFSVELSELYES